MQRSQTRQVRTTRGLFRINWHPREGSLQIPIVISIRGLAAPADCSLAGSAEDSKYGFHADFREKGQSLIDNGRTVTAVYKASTEPITKLVMHQQIVRTMTSENAFFARTKRAR